MGRRVRDAILETRNARRALKVRSKPYWRALDQGLHIGYRKRGSGGSWIARRFSENGKYVESKLGTADDYQDADGVKTLTYFQGIDAARRWQTQSLQSESDGVVPDKANYTVTSALDDYLEHYKVEGKGLSVIRNIINAHIKPQLGGIRVDKLTSRRIELWHHALAEIPARVRTKQTAKEQKFKEPDRDPDAVRRRRATANRNLTVLKAALNYVWRQGKTPSDTAWRRVKPFKNVDAPVIRYLQKKECERLVNVCPNDLRQMVLAALYTGCRYGELTRLTVSDFNADSGTVAVRISKSGKPRFAILTEEGQSFFSQAVIGKKGSDLLFVHEDGSAWGKSHQSRPILEACQRAKIDPPITFHVLRHTHGSILAMKGVPMPVIAKQLGHADTRMTEKHYAHLSPNYVAETIRQNFPKMGLFKPTNVTPIKGKK